MLIRPERHPQRQLSFQQQLTCVKKAKCAPSEFEKSEKNYQLTVSVLDLLADRSPQIADELLMVKRAISKWYDHVREENVLKNREVLHMREQLVVEVKQEVGIVLQQIGYYLRSIIQQYNDENLQIFYAKYLTTLKKLEWGIEESRREKMLNKDVQTEFECVPSRVIQSQRSIERESCFSTIESPMKKYKQVDLQKYIETKEQNLQLERKCDQMGSILSQLQEENKKLKTELARLFKQNEELNENTERYLDDIGKLTKILDKMKEEEESKKDREEKIKSQIDLTENKYSRFKDLKGTISKELDNIEEQLQRKEEQFLSQSVQGDEKSIFSEQKQEGELRTEKKRAHFLRQQSSDINYQMLLLQAILIEDLMTEKEEK